MNLQIKGTGMEVTPEIKNYITNKLETAGRMMDTPESEALFQVEVGMDTKRHKNGEIYRAECNARSAGKKIRSVSQKDDMYAAIDDMKDDVERQLKELKDRKEGLFRRGARSVKKMLKGLSDRNPFTSKY
ncbi:MAG TPA: ribosome-associated translation inhibitor RaiA [Candidatus Paceibacterota bacterium]|nr:ribosome-associated translation inhibitor RaiA [Candidatus Paceibacterota bacterium]